MKKVLVLVSCVAILAMVPACKKLGCPKEEQAPQEIPTMPVQTAPTPEMPQPTAEIPAPTPEAPK